MLIDESKKDTKLPGILRAALELFVERGINATTIAEIAKRAGTAEGTLYRHFKSKEEMAYHLFSVHLTELTNKLFESIKSEKTARGKLRKAITDFFVYFENDRLMFSYIFLSQHQELKHWPEGDKTPYHVVESILKLAKKEGRLRKIHMDLAVAIVLGITARVTEQKMIGTLKSDLRKLAPQVAEASWRAVCN